MTNAEIITGNRGYSTEVEASMEDKVCKLYITIECPACHPRRGTRTLHPLCLCCADGYK